ncbi:type I DNA topoisomerase [Stella sp.]|uniref:type I DNA topoisomerase n=1 Tax=Stella sp. TaxID=2912054 RepID=UPI0035B159C2
MNVVVVESPAKAKTINKYLGPGFQVLASYGHVRDLPAKDGSVDPEHDFAMEWEVDGKSEKHLRAIAEATRGASNLYLATDPDREGEAISWHVREVLEQRRALKGVAVQRVVFNEITKAAITEAFRHPRELNRELVDAYLARRALDYLVGFTLSPVLWRKLPGSRSAGRVQSVALRLICEREAEIEAFKPQEYWTVEATFLTEDGNRFTARLTHLAGRKLEKLDIGTAAAAAAAVAAVEARTFHVGPVERKQVRRHPQPPFTTSTLQQEASRQLGMTASRTMRTAQRLYEGVDIGGETVGLITYMRTDGVQISGEAIAAARRLIHSRYGERFVPDAPRVYRTQAKNAQEAHEGIRPTDLFRTPDQVAAHLSDEERRLYELVWRRTVASQMESALLEQVGADLLSGDRQVTLRATGSTLLFEGFLKLYREGRDDAEDEDGERRLPPLVDGASVDRQGVTSEQHFTQPPPRYSEASLVKRLEELGIGRPSTYASIIEVLQDRGYVRLDRKRFVPEDRGRLVTAFLTGFFEKLVQYNFTAELETGLDAVSDGRIDWRQLLRDFWQEFNAQVAQTKDLSIKDVVTALDADLGRHFFPDTGEGGRDPRACPTCGDGRLGLKLGKFGAFIGCSNYPECRYTRPLAIEGGDGTASAEGDPNVPKKLGEDPDTGLPVWMRKGPYGQYVQLGDADGGDKPKRQSIPKGLAPGDVTLDTALALLALPRTVGTHPESGEPILAGIGRFGPYLKHGSVYKSLGAGDDVLTIGLNRAVDLLASAPGRGGRQPGRPVGEHPDDGKPITVHAGRYGPYVQHGDIRATLPKGMVADAVTVAVALPLLAERAAKAPAKAGGRKRAAPKAAATKAPAAEGKAAAKAKAAPKPKAAASKTTTAARKSAPKAAGKPAAAKTAKPSTARRKPAAGDDR